MALTGHAEPIVVVLLGALLLLGGLLKQDGEAHRAA